MEIQVSDQFKEQLLQVLAALPLSEQQKVLNFALSLHWNELAQKWDAISDQEAFALRDEFADEDKAMAEARLSDYLQLL